jgi:hypothetical protein
MQSPGRVSKPVIKRFSFSGSREGYGEADEYKNQMDQYSTPEDLHQKPYILA